MNPTSLRVGTSHKDIRDILASYYADPILMARQVVPHWFPEPMPWFHRGTLAILLRQCDFLLNFGEEEWPLGVGRYTKKDFSKIVRHFVYRENPEDPRSPEHPIFRVRYDDSGRKAVGIEMVLGRYFLEIIPRGYAKTTLVKFALLRRTLYLQTRFFAYLSETATHANAQLEDIKRELESNERIHALWGNIVPSREDPQKWTEGEIETLTGVKAVARGRGQQIRGLNRFGDRPDTIVEDDIEDKESVSTETQRQKTINWHAGDVEPALSRNPREGITPTIYSIGTMLHNQAMLPTLAKTKRYTSVILGAIDRDGDALWAGGNGLSLPELEKERLHKASIGQLYSFHLEYLSTVRSDLSSRFRQDQFRYLERLRDEFLEVAIALDPAISKKKTSAMSAIAVVGVDDKGRKHVLDTWSKVGADPSEQIDAFFSLHYRWRATRHGVEAVAYQAALVHMIREQMFRRSKEMGALALFEVDEIYPGRQRKEERVEGILQPLYTAGLISHQRVFPELESQLIDWPNGLMDLPDVLAMAVALLEPYSPFAIENPEQLLSEETMEPLDPEGAP